MSTRSLLLALLVVVSVTATPAAAAEDPRFEASVEEPTLTPGERATVTVTIQNTAEEVDEAVEAAEAVEAELGSGDSSIQVRSGSKFLGPLGDDERTSVSFTVDVPSHIEPGAYDLPVDLTYEHDDEMESQRTHATVRVLERPRFDVVDVDGSVQPGETRNVSVTVENVGWETANETRLELTGGNGVTLSEGQSSTLLGSVAPNETRTVDVEAAVGESVTSSTVPIDAQFEFEDTLGYERGPTTASDSLTVSPEQSFAIRNVSDTLAVGFDGEISGTIENEGPETVTDATLLIEPRTDSLFVEDTRYALEPLAPGETTTFTYPTDVGGEADAGPRDVRFTVEYDSEETTRTDGPHSARVVVDPFTRAFDVDGVSASVRSGESSTLVLSVTNERPVELSNVDAMLYTDSPLDAPGDSAFVSELEPGETTEMSFEIAAEEDARNTTFPVELDFEYETPRGTSEVSDTYQVPVAVMEPAEEDGPDVMLLTLGGVAILALIGLGYWYRRK